MVLQYDSNFLTTTVPWVIFSAVLTHLSCIGIFGVFLGLHGHANG